MLEYLRKVGGQIFKFISDLSPGKKAGLVITGLAVIFGMAAMFKWAGEKQYMPLMTNLGPEDSANVIRVLRDKKIPFRVDPSGKTIEIPPESVYDLRLELATMGLPDSSVIGYELFDKQALGTTSFVQQLNSKRALEGELMRTIGALKGVKKARVHLVLPKKSAFIEDQKKPTASVFIDLEAGTQLSEKQVYGIGTLVSSAVEGLDLADVSIVDAGGKTLSKTSRDPLVAMTATQLDFQRKLEEDMERRISQILIPMVGEGRVVARVTADVDFSQVNETQTIYDADGSALRSIDKDMTSQEGSRPGPMGAPGAISNTPGEPGVAEKSQIKSDTKKNREITNYAVPQTVRQTQKQLGKITKLSVAVVVDGKSKKSTNAEGVAETKIESWPPEALVQFETLVANSVGLNKKRGDTLEIKNMEFTREDMGEAERQIAEKERRTYFQNLLVYGVIGLIIVLFFMFVVRPFIKWVTENTIDSVDTFLPQTIEELEKMSKSQTMQTLEEVIPDLPEKIDPEKVEGEMIKEKIISLVDNNPHKAAMIVRDWIKEEPKTEVDKGNKTA